MFNRTLTFLFAVFLTFLILPQSAEAQDQHRTDHLTPWSEIDFSDNPNIRVQKKNRHCLVAEVTNIPGRSRYLLYFNAEYETGRAVVNGSIKRSVQACEQIIRDVVGRAHAVTFFGTDNSVPNYQSANMPLSETDSPAREQSNDYRLAQLRANSGRNLIVSELSDIALENAGNYVPAKYETQTVSAPDSLQRLDNLSDQASLEFRKSFFIMAETYKEGAPNVQAFESRIAAMKGDVNERFERVHSRIDSLGREHQRTRRLAVANTDSINAVRDDLQDVRQADQGDSFSTLSAGYRSELGLHMGQIGFETGNPVSLRFALGASSKGITTELCNDNTDVSRAVYAEIGGRYTSRPSKWLSLGVGLSTTGTLLSLEETKGLLVLSVGPDVEVTANLTDNLSLHGGVGYNYRHYLQNKLALSKNASSTSAELTVGFSFSF